MYLSGTKIAQCFHRRKEEEEKTETRRRSLADKNHSESEMAEEQWARGVRAEAWSTASDNKEKPDLKRH